jgi:anti-anti-sigma regulatory factor
MLELEMHSADSCAVITVSGSLDTPDGSDTMAAALTFVPVDDHLIVDLRTLEHLSESCATALCTRLLDRVSWAEAVVVSDRPEITKQLILSDVDRVVPVLSSIDHAAQVIRSRSGFDIAEVA